MEGKTDFPGISSEYQHSKMLRKYSSIGKMMAKAIQMKPNDRRDEPRAHSGFVHAVGLGWTCWPFDKDCGPPLGRKAE